MKNLALILTQLLVPVAHAAEFDVSHGDSDPTMRGAETNALTPPSMITMDFKRYLAPLNVKVDGPSDGIRTALPIGNGHMGGVMVVGGKSKSQLLFNLGRSDVFYSGGGCQVSDKSPYNHKGVIAKVELDFGTPVFAACRQEVNVY